MNCKRCGQELTWRSRDWQLERLRRFNRFTDDEIEQAMPLCETCLTAWITAHQKREVCAICSQPFNPRRRVAVRTAWLRAGGAGRIPDAAKVHQVCDWLERCGRGAV